MLNLKKILSLSLFASLLGSASTFAGGGPVEDDDNGMPSAAVVHRSADFFLNKETGNQEKTPGSLQQNELNSLAQAKKATVIIATPVNESFEAKVLRRLDLDNEEFIKALRKQNLSKEELTENHVRTAIARLEAIARNKYDSAKESERPLLQIVFKALLPGESVRIYDGEEGFHIGPSKKRLENRLRRRIGLPEIS